MRLGSISDGNKKFLANSCLESCMESRSPFMQPYTGSNITLAYEPNRQPWNLVVLQPITRMYVASTRSIVSRGWAGWYNLSGGVHVVEGLVAGICGEGAFGTSTEGTVFCSWDSTGLFTVLVLGWMCTWGTWNVGTKRVHFVLKLVPLNICSGHGSRGTGTLVCWGTWWRSSTHVTSLVPG